MSEKVKCVSVYLDGCYGYTVPANPKDIACMLDGELDGIDLGDDVVIELKVVGFTQDEIDNFGEFAGW